MNEIIFNERNDKEKPRLFICGFSEGYREMLCMMFSSEMTLCTSEPHIVIAEEGSDLGTYDVPVVVIGQSEGRRNNRFYMKRPVDLKRLRRVVMSLAMTEGDDEEKQEVLSYDKETLTVSVGNKSTRLTSLEFALFLLLYNNRGVSLPREKIMDALWQEQGGSNVCDVYVCYLRKKLEPLMGKGNIISLRGKGYMMRKTDK